MVTRSLPTLRGDIALSATLSLSLPCRFIMITLTIYTSLRGDWASTTDGSANPAHDKSGGPVAEALRTLQAQTFPTQADNLQSACAKAPAEAKGLFECLAALVGASGPPTALATPAFNEKTRE